MGIFNNLDKYENVDLSQYINIITEQINRGMKIDSSDNNYDADNKKRKNVASASESSDAVTKGDLDTVLIGHHSNTENIDLQNRYEGYQFNRWLTTK